MELFEGQTESAKIVKELRGKIPSKLKPFIDFRPTKDGITIVSLFDYYPMRGKDIRRSSACQNELEKVMQKIDDRSSILLSAKSDDDKIRIFEELGFKIPDKQSEKEYLESDVQASIIRDLINGGVWKRTLTKTIPETISLNYLTSELAWSDRLDNKEGKGRPDIVCLGLPNFVVIIEVKKVRQTDLQQVVSYKTKLENNIKSFLSFATALSGSNLPNHLIFKTVFVMPYTTGRQPEWKKIARNYETTIVFYQYSFPPEEPILPTA